MDDLISRQAAKDAITESDVFVFYDEHTSIEDAVEIAIRCTKKSIIDSIEAIPSTEPERKPETKLVAEVTLTEDQIQDAVDKAVEKMRAELAPCDFCKYKDDCGDMAIYCPAERREDSEVTT